MAGLAQWLVMAMGLQASLGPLVSPQGQPGVCSAFLAHHQGQTFLYTAAHCLKPGQVKLWLPGLEGDASRLRESQWSTVTTVRPDQWERHAWQDLAWKPMEAQVPTWSVGPMPPLGALLTVEGYPEGRGPQALSCQYVGVALLDDGGQPRPRPSLDCPRSGSEAFRRHTGFSGGVVLDEHRRAVGVLVSGSVTASGNVRPAFEPILPWLKEGASSHPIALPWDTTEKHLVHLVVQKGRVLQYTVKSPSGVSWSHWPVLQAKKGADSLPE